MRYTKQREHLAGDVRKPTMGTSRGTPSKSGEYLRVDAAEVGKVSRDGIFVAAYGSVHGDALDAWARDEVLGALQTLATKLPILEVDDARAIFFVREDALGIARKLWELARLLRAQGIFVEIFVAGAVR